MQLESVAKVQGSPGSPVAHDLFLQPVCGLPILSNQQSEVFTFTVIHLFLDAYARMTIEFT